MGPSYECAALIGALALTSVAGTGLAAGLGAATGCGCTPAHPAGGTGTPPAVVVNIPTIIYGGSESSASSTSSASTTVTSTTTANSQALINEANSGYGGGSGGWSESGGVSTTIDTIKVESPIETRRICAAFKTEMKVIAIQASCLDDKDVPHPASQLAPEREVADGYDGEIYRCIAGARMQYTLATYAGQLNLDHGQTLTCQKGEALYHTGAGALQCRGQKPARDCNERSLLRRYGAGIKLIHASQRGECVTWKTETVQAEAGQ